MIDTPSPELTLSLNPAQREAVEHVHGPMLVLAGAGSGKTRVLTTRIAALIDEHGVPPDRIFAVTFTNKAAGEMKERIGQLLGRDPSGLWIGTFHSLSARLLRREAERLGFSRAVHDLRRGRPAQPHQAADGAARALDQALSAPRGAGDHLVGQEPDGVRRRRWPRRRHSIAWSQVAADIYGRAWRPALKAANAMDFDDLLLHPLDALPRAPRPAAGVSGPIQLPAGR